MWLLPVFFPPRPARRRRLVRAAAVVLLALAPASAPALVFTVDAAKDLPDVLPGDGICASDAGTCSLRAAVDEANALPGPDAIVVPRGRYRLVLGSLVAADDLELAGDGAAPPTIQGDGLQRVLAVGAGVNVAVSDLTLRSGGGEDGAGIHNAGLLELTRVVLMRHSAEAASGGALYNAGTATLREVRVLGNNAFFGAGIYNAGILTVEDTLVRRNRHSVDGGGAGLFNLGEATIVRSSFVKNQARIGLGGGAIYNDNLLEVTNSTISRNRARIGTGGGVVTGPNGVTTLFNVTLLRNQARFYSGGIANFGVTAVHNTIVAENFNNRVRDINCGGDVPVLSLGFNLDSGAVCSFAGPGDLSNAKPYTRSENLNGGLTPSRALMPQSPAIDAGDPDLCPATDQRGAPRPQDGDADAQSRCDIGAFEIQPDA